MSNIFALGAHDTMAKLAAGNPAAPQKRSLGDGPIDMGLSAPYLNMGGGKAQQHQAGDVMRQPQPWPGHVNIGDKKPGVQVGGDVENRSGAPDTGERGSSGGDMTVTKSAAFEIGFNAIIDAFIDDDA